MSQFELFDALAGVTTSTVAVHPYESLNLNIYFFAVKHRSWRYGDMETYKKQDQSKTLFPLISP